MKKSLLFIFISYSFFSFGRCPNIEGTYSPGGKGNPDSFVILRKINCSTFAMIRGLGESTYTIALGVPEKCEDLGYVNVCYRGDYRSANEVNFFFKEAFTRGGCLKEINYILNEENKSLAISQSENCQKTGIKSLPKINFLKERDK